MANKVDDIKLQLVREFNEEDIKDNQKVKKKLLKTYSACRKQYVVKLDFRLE